MKSIWCGTVQSVLCQNMFPVTRSKRGHHGLFSLTHQFIRSLQSEALAAAASWHLLCSLLHWFPTWPLGRRSGPQQRSGPSVSSCSGGSAFINTWFFFSSADIRCPKTDRRLGCTAVCCWTCSIPSICWLCSFSWWGLASAGGGYVMTELSDQHVRRMNMIFRLSS